MHLWQIFFWTTEIYFWNIEPAARCFVCFTCQPVSPPVFTHSLWSYHLQFYKILQFAINFTKTVTLSQILCCLCWKSPDSLKKSLSFVIHCVKRKTKKHSVKHHLWQKKETWITQKQRQSFPEHSYQRRTCVSGQGSEVLLPALVCLDVCYQISFKRFWMDFRHFQKRSEMDKGTWLDFGCDPDYSVDPRMWQR